MTADDLKTIHKQLTGLVAAMSQTGVSGSKQQHVVEALKAALDPVDVQLLCNKIEHAYGILALRGVIGGDHASHT